MQCRFVVWSCGLSALCLMNSNGTLALLDCCDQARECFIIQNWKALGHAQGRVLAALENCRVSWTSWLPPLPSSVPSVEQRGILQPAWTELNQPACTVVIIDFPVVVTRRRGAEHTPLTPAFCQAWKVFLASGHRSREIKPSKSAHTCLFADIVPGQGNHRSPKQSPIVIHYFLEIRVHYLAQDTVEDVPACREFQCKLKYYVKQIFAQIHIMVSFKYSKFEFFLKDEVSFYF